MKEEKKGKDKTKKSRVEMMHCLDEQRQKKKIEMKKNLSLCKWKREQKEK